MKKRILFIQGTMDSGGVSKSIASLLHVLDPERYDVSLLLVSPRGPFLELLPAHVRVLTDPVFEALTQRLGGFRTLLRLGHPLRAVGHLLRLVVGRIDRGLAAWMIAKMAPALDEAFDAVVDYGGQQQLYYMVLKLRAPRKISFFHSDYAQWPYYYRMDRRFYPRVDALFTVSEQCVESLRRYFPQLGDRIRLLENITPPRLIEQLAAQPVEDLDRSKPCFLTVGHVSPLKGSDWAIEAAGLLRQRGLDFNWYFLGSVSDPERYCALAARWGVADRVHFLGVRVNPYPYIAGAELIVHPSQFEGKSIVLDEARLLCKPVVATDFSTVGDQFTDRVDASICAMTPASIAEAVFELHSDPALQRRYRDCLAAHRADNTSEVEKLYAALEGR